MAHGTVVFAAMLCISAAYASCGFCLFRQSTRTWRTDKHCSKFLSPTGIPTTFLFFHTKPNGNIPTGTPPFKRGRKCSWGRQLLNQYMASRLVVYAATAKCYTHSCTGPWQVGDTHCWYTLCRLLFTTTELQGQCHCGRNVKLVFVACLREKCIYSRKTKTMRKVKGKWTWIYIAPCKGVRCPPIFSLSNLINVGWL